MDGERGGGIPYTTHHREILSRELRGLFDGFLIVVVTLSWVGG